MIFIVGLGNPGKKFVKTRHNLGRLVISNWQLAISFPKFKFSKKFKALLSQRTFNRTKILLALPETYMNESGKAIKSLITSYQLPVANLWIIHDDLDLPLGKMKISIGRSSAGHKGVQSIIDKLRTKNFVRFRIGIKPKPSSLIPKTPDKFVLQKFNKGEGKIVKKVIKKTIESIEFALKEGLEKAMQKFNS